MIKVKILTGRYAGVERVIPATVNPLDLLCDLARDDTKWETDYSAATSAELLDWGRAELVARTLAALTHGRFVRFEDPAGPREWRVAASSSKEETMLVVGEIEDAIVYSGMNVGVKSDDEYGVVIGTAGPENPVQ